jgi:CRP-like cAMP-binding protein
VAKLEPGACFGEMALLKKQLRAARITCNTYTQVAYFEKQEFKKIVGLAQK